MSESGTMFNERDWRCVAVQLMRSTDPSNDNRTIDSTLKMQTRLVQRAQGYENKVSGYGYGLYCGFTRGPHHATSHLRCRRESQHQSIRGCTEECGDLLVQSGGRRRTLGVSAGLGTCPQVQRDPSLASKGCYDFIPFSHTPAPPTWTHWTTSFGHTSRTSPTWPPKTPKPAWSRYPPSIRRAPAGGCVKSMIPVPNPYRGGDWGRRRLHWIDVSSTTSSSFLNWFFSIKVLK